jgi:bifunctional non-homologous end joining protein LigD
MHHPDALSQGNARRWPARYGCPVGRLCHLEVVHTGDMLNNAVAGVVPDVHAVHGQVRTRLVLARWYLYPMLSRTRPPPSGFIEPCLPSSAGRPPSGPGWIHEIKHDGYRLMARRDPIGIRLLTRNGHDWALRYPLIVEAVDRLKMRSCLIDGESVACDENGLAVFEQLRRKPSGKHVFLYAFDLLELDGQDLRREPLETRKATLASLLRGSLPGARLNEHLAHDGESVFRHACKMGLEGIVSKRLGSRYRSGRSRHWVKSGALDDPLRS